MPCNDLHYHENHVQQLYSRFHILLIVCSHSSWPSHVSLHYQCFLPPFLLIFSKTCTIFLTFSTTFVGIPLLCNENNDCYSLDMQHIVLNQLHYTTNTPLVQEWPPPQFTPTHVFYIKMNAHACNRNGLWSLSVMCFLDMKTILYLNFYIFSKFSFFLSTCHTFYKNIIYVVIYL